MARNSRKDIYDSAKKRANLINDNIDNYRTPFVQRGIIGDVVTNRFTEDASNSSRNELNKEQLKYFERPLSGSFDFKFGMQVQPGENGDEDPVIFGFDIIINTQGSPLFNGDSAEAKIEDIFNFADSNSIKELANRREIYDKFNEQFSKLFFKTDSNYRNIKSFYIQEVKGLDKLINQSMGLQRDGKKQFNEYGKDGDKITVSIYEDNKLNSGYMAVLYNTLAYSKKNGKQLVPENLLRFDMSIIVSEMRNYTKVLSSLENGNNVLNVVNDNVSRYKYNLYDCQFEFDKMSHPDTISNKTKESTESFDVNIHYKFSSLELEKFNLNLGEHDTREYLNNGEVDPRSKFNGESSNQMNLTDMSYRTNRNEYIRFDNSAEPGNNVNTFLTPPVENNLNDDGTIGNTNPLADAKKNNINNRLNQEDEEEELTGIARIVNDSKAYAKQRATFLRDRLINNTLQKIRTRTGLRRISSPMNVYNSEKILNFIGGQVRDFANTQFTDAIQQSKLYNENAKASDINELNDEYNSRILGGLGNDGQGAQLD